MATQIAYTKASHPEWVRGLKQDDASHLIHREVSHPEWVRGLKLYCILYHILAYLVAPRVGAWIETEQKPLIPSSKKSHPEWVRGLKLLVAAAPVHSLASHPEWVRGLKRLNS